MENKINIAELLRDCPQGMELDCTMYNDLTFVEVIEYDAFPIVTELPDGSKRLFTNFGCYDMYNESKCVIFPKGKTTWEGFVPPCKFKEGDIISNDMYIAIFYKADRPYTDFKRDVLYYHCWYNRKYNEFKVETDYGIGHIEGYKLATKEEKLKLFQAIKDNGYHWNEETKTLEKLVEPMFKVNNIIRHKERKSNTRIVDIKDSNYIFKNGDIMPIYLQDNYEFVTDKFDINTLKPFDKVLVRDTEEQVWVADLFSHMVIRPLGGYTFACVGHYPSQCIPYEGNEHLLGTTDDCEDYYKTW